MSLLQACRKRALTVLACGVLASCGGGVYLELGDYDSLPPVVDLAAAAVSARAGDSVRLIAAAADENGIDEVRFYRYDGNTAVRLGSDGFSPYDWQLLVPADGRTSVIVFARAFDNAGNAADSNLVTISITP